MRHSLTWWLVAVSAIEVLAVFGAIMGLSSRAPETIHDLASWLIALAIVAAAIATGLCVAVAWHVFRPLRSLARKMLAYGAGAKYLRSHIERRDEIGILASQFDAIADKLAAEDGSKDDLLGAIANELRGPLTRIHLTLDRMAEGQDLEANVSSALDELTSLERLADDVLVLARHGGKDVSSEASDIELRSVVDAILTRETDASSGSVRVSGSSVVRGNRRLLKRALRNVIVNALTHGASPAGVDIDIASDPAGTATVTISDRGAGMTKTMLESAFDPFRRGPSSEGTGLGLSIARRFVEQSGGAIGLESERGRGTTVTITLP